MPVDIQSAVASLCQNTSSLVRLTLSDPLWSAIFIALIIFLIALVTINKSGCSSSMSGAFLALRIAAYSFIMLVPIIFLQNKHMLKINEKTTIGGVGDMITGLHTNMAINAEDTDHIDIHKIIGGDDGDDDYFI